MRAVSSEGHGRIKFFKQVRKNLVEDASFRKYFEGETTELPAFYLNLIKKDLGIWFQWLPEGALQHDQNAYLHKQKTKPVINNGHVHFPKEEQTNIQVNN